jgi:hypothetical protein
MRENITLNQEQQKRVYVVLIDEGLTRTIRTDALSFQLRSGNPAIASARAWRRNTRLAAKLRDLTIRFLYRSGCPWLLTAII